MRRVRFAIYRITVDGRLKKPAMSTFGTLAAARGAAQIVAGTHKPVSIVEEESFDGRTWRAIHETLEGAPDGAPPTDEGTE